MNKKIKDSIVEEYKEKFSKKDFIPGESFIPISGKIFDEKEIINIVDAAIDGWWTEGRFSNLFEQKICKWLNIKYATLVNSGSSANLVAISALMSAKLGEKRLKSGDEVITVAAGFPTTVNPIIQNGLIPVFVDVELGTYNINIEEVKKAITTKTRAVFFAHTLGNPCDLDAVAQLCEDYNLWFIEDNCDGLGSIYKDKKTGTFGHISTCSFYPAHHITMGEGGAVFTNDALLNRIVRSIRDWGRDCWCKTGEDDTCDNRFCWQLGDLPPGYDHKYIYSELGYNLKMTDMQAAIGVAQLEKLDNFIQQRKNNFSYLYNNLKKFEKYFILPEWLDDADPSWFGFLLTVKDSVEFSRGSLIKFLQKNRIGMRLLFAGNLTKQPYFIEKNIKYRISGELKNTDIIMNNTFWVGVYPGLKKEMLDHIIDTINIFIKQYK